jgi:predicted nucleic acid-binding protein
VIAVADAGPLIILGRTGYLGVLRHLFAKVIVPDAVWAEVMVDEGSRAGAANVEASLWLERRSNLPAVAIGRLGAGEVQAIALAAHLGAGRVLLDDLAARKEAVRRGLTPVGTLGVLAEGRRRGHVGDLSAALLAVRGAGLLVSDELIESVMSQFRHTPD